jgi:hypothetical protein
MTAALSTGMEVIAAMNNSATTKGNLKWYTNLAKR